MTNLRFCDNNSYSDKIIVIVTILLPLRQYVCLSDKTFVTVTILLLQLKSCSCVHTRQLRIDSSLSVALHTAARSSEHCCAMTRAGGKDASYSSAFWTIGKYCFVCSSVGEQVYIFGEKRDLDRAQLFIDKMSAAHSLIDQPISSLPPPSMVAFPPRHFWACLVPFGDQPERFIRGLVASNLQLTGSRGSLMCRYAGVHPTRPSSCIKRFGSLNTTDNQVTSRMIDKFSQLFWSMSKLDIAKL